MDVDWCTSQHVQCGTYGLDITEDTGLIMDLTSWKIRDICTGHHRRYRTYVLDIMKDMGLLTEGY